MDLGELGPLVNAGGVLVFSYVVWRSLEKKRDQDAADRREDREALVAGLERLHEGQERVIERLARIDTRTHRADTAADADETPPLGRRRTRTPPTPFTTMGPTTSGAGSVRGRKP